MPAFRDQNGALHQVNIDVSMYRAAANNNCSLPQWVNRQFETNPEVYGSAFHQILASEGIFLRPQAEVGLRAANMDEILNGRARFDEAGSVVKDAVPASRILFPAAILAAIEDKLAVDLETTANAFDQMIAVDDTIAGDRFERPILNFSRPEAARKQGISQLALPASMLSITASDVSRKIPTQALGMEISEQALKGTTLDLVGLALARQAATERNERAQGYILAMLNGDTDMAQLALSTISNKVVKANVYDSTISAAGQLTNKAWVKWLIKNSAKRRIDWVITDVDGALAIDGRSGRPAVIGTTGTNPQITTNMVVANPSWTDNVKVFITDDPAWPANTIMGIDSRYALHRVTSLSASYEAVEQFALKRSTALRFDHGEIVYRLFDEAFEVLSLTT